MDERQPRISVTIRLPDYRDRLVAETGKQVADLSHALRALEDGSFIERATSKRPQAVFDIEYANLDVESGAEQRHIQTCFRAVVAAFITFLDQMIAIQRIAMTGIPINPDLAESEVLPYVREYVQKSITTVANERSLTNPKKIAAFPGLSAWAKQASTALFALRRCYEHHGGVAESDFVICYRALRFFAGKDEITSLPYMARENTGIGIGLVEREIVVKAGERPELTEQQLRDIVNTIELPLATEILNLVTHNMSGTTQAG